MALQRDAPQAGFARSLRAPELTRYASKELVSFLRAFGKENMTHRYRESASLKVRVRRGKAGDSASGGSVQKKQKRSGSGFPVFSCLGHAPRHNKSLVRTPGSGVPFPVVSVAGAAHLYR